MQCRSQPALEWIVEQLGTTFKNPLQGCLWHSHLWNMYDSSFVAEDSSITGIYNSWSCLCCGSSGHHSHHTLIPTHQVRRLYRHDVVVYIHCLLHGWRGSTRRASMEVKSKPLPPLKRLKERESDEEEIEMRGLVATTEEDKDDYYFEDPSNIGTYHSL